ncbi:GDSL esterase/lipase [Melia azedarach]|uniref:GDSL esterase/lipase n=1 Tax=Melia azedarach TaxID=155640 RepID=A0ACC1WSL6_MELAZ|nr:GDSL esterase/lipase [Melia azedarach]
MDYKLEDLHKLGARRIGVFSTLPIGCLPSQRTLGGGRGRKCVETYNQAAELLNFKLSKMINNLNSKLPQANLVYVDDYNLLNDMIKNPKTYGNSSSVTMNPLCSNMATDVITMTCFLQDLKFQTEVAVVRVYLRLHLCVINGIHLHVEMLRTMYSGIVITLQRKHTGLWSISSSNI